MRKRNGWLVGLVAAAMVLTPALVRGQDRQVPLAALATAGPAGAAAGLENSLPALAPGGPRWELGQAAEHSEQPAAVNPLENGGVFFQPVIIYRGQAADVGASDPEFPIPLSKSRPEQGGLYVAGEFLFWRMTNNLHDEQIAVRGVLDVDGSITGFPGGFLGTRQAALVANDAAGPGTYQPGYRVTGGWLFANGIAVEINWVHLFEAKYSAVAGIEPAFGVSGMFLANTFLTSFVFNFPPDFAGPARKVDLGLPGATFGIWDASSVQTIEFTQRYDEYDLTARFPLFGDDCNRTYWTLGPRIAWIWERFKWRTVAFDVDTGQAGQDDVAIYSNVLSQRLYGAHLGCGYEWYKGGTPIGAFAISLDGQASLYANIAKEEAKYERGDFAIANQRKRRDYTIVPELQAMLNLWWYPMQGVQLRIGYDFMAYFNTVSSPDPVSFNYGALDPPWVKGTTRIIEGFNAGIGFSF
jgi:hypothetical protein